ncbi:MAG: acyltransferase [Frankiales bacterium]|nr:acyltransferase [Frankiales bacterium]
MADVSVRPAFPGDAEEIARIQIQTWQLAYTNVLPQAILDNLEPVAMTDGWRAAIVAPPSLQHHVLLAWEGESRVGFVAFGPDADTQDDDPHPEHTWAVTALLVEPRWGRRGHGSRMLAAVADLGLEAGTRRLVAWVPAADTASLEFYRAAGWAADGLQRTLDTGAGTVNELRVHASLVPELGLTAAGGA